MKIAALAGGTGAAKLLRGLARLVDPGDLTIIGNTGDDLDLWGLHVSPDLDTVCYTLASIVDAVKGWGLGDESFHALDAMHRFGEPTWFNLGDRDLATHLHRTGLLRQGRTLTQVTASVAAGLGVAQRVLPMSNQPVRTGVLGPDGWLDFQEYFVREKAQIAVRAVRYEGAESARPAPGVVEAILEARAVIVCPSNPITSVGPILAVPGIARALGESRATALAISPIVGGEAVSGPAGRLMAACGLPVSAVGVAQVYAPWLDTIVLDQRDAGLAAELAALGVSALTTDTVMTSPEKEIALARRILDALR